MAWYVFALVDELPSGRAARGLSGRLASRRVPGGHAIVERRADVPPAEFGTLTKHQAVVSRLAASVPAILPVRFGTLLETDALEEALGEREDDVADAFALVRNRVQFTWRKRGARTEVRGPGKTESGSEYLRRVANPPLPAAFRTLRAKLKPLVVRERYQPATAALPDSLYHLVDKASASRYRVAAGALAHANPTLTVRGPFPPFAFVPELL